MRYIYFLLLLLLVIHPAQAEIQTQELSYAVGGVQMKGYLVYDDSNNKKRPGILVVHEWWGHNDYSRERARMLAEMGYTALALDMYGDGKQASHPKQAGEFSSAVKSNIPVAKKRFLAALKLLKQHPTTDPKQIAAIGYCFGGGIVLEMARLGIDLDAVVSFHGSLSTKQSFKPGSVKTKVLVCNGAADPFVTMPQIEQFKNEMRKGKIDFTFKSYADAKHAFTNPAADNLGKKFNIPLAYNVKADKDSWRDMQEFLQHVFQQK